MRYQTEPFTHFWNDARSLLEDHYEEISSYPDIPLIVDTDAYLELEGMDKLRVYTVRDGNNLIGYVLFMVVFNLHYMTSRQAIQDVLYMHPDYRRTGIAAELLGYTENELRNEGVQVVYHHAKIQHPALGKLLTSMGYDITDELYAKRLDIGD